MFDNSHSRVATVTATLLLVALPQVASPQTTRETDEREAIHDTDVTSAIEAEYLLDDSVPFHAIDVSTAHGVVSLHGIVSTPLERLRATEIARAIKGVRSVINTITVRPPNRDDASIRHDIEEALVLDPVADSIEVEVHVDDGIVTLTGETDSWHEKQITLDVARGIRGVREVRDEIGISVDGVRLDSEIAKEIRRWLDTDIRVDAELVDVSVVDGRVDLSGTVGSAAERARAYADAWVTGVTEVSTDALEVEWWARDAMIRQRVPRLTDAEIAEAVRAAFARDPRLGSGIRGVHVNDGIATLTGRVSNVAARRAAEEDARNTVGIWKVRNHIKVRPHEPIEDAVIEDRVSDAFRRDPFLDASNITAHSANGIVYLSGQVDSLWQETRAESLAVRTNGVVDVVNALVVRPPVGKSDWELADDVRSGLFWNPFVDSDDVTVMVENGVVTLEGTVSNWREWGAAHDEAIEAGAATVRNRLIMAGGVPGRLNPSSGE